MKPSDLTEKLVIHDAKMFEGGYYIIASDETTSSDPYQMHLLKFTLDGNMNQNATYELSTKIILNTDMSCITKGEEIVFPFETTMPLVLIASDPKNAKFYELGISVVNKKTYTSDCY